MAFLIIKIPIIFNKNVCIYAVYKYFFSLCIMTAVSTLTYFYYCVNGTSCIVLYFIRMCLFCFIPSLVLTSYLFFGPLSKYAKK
jgi:hypothetical protein